MVICAAIVVGPTMSVTAAGAHTAPPVRVAGATCPAAVVIPARGSGDPAVAPQRYGRSTTDGLEGPLLSMLLTATYGGAADIAAVPVVSTGPGYRAVSVPEGAATRGFGASIASGVSAVTARYDAVARAGGPGCRPRAVLVGYSQGAAVVREAARRLAARAVVRAVMTFGDPFQLPGADGVVGAGSRGIGVWRTDAGAAVSGIDTVGIDSFYRLPGVTRWSLCHGGDPVCDLGPTADPTGSPHNTYLRAGLRYVPAAGRPATRRTELVVAVETLRSFIRTAVAGR
ncbi:hypothetical protein GCM10009722_38210 [Williamsia deligens]|nr:Cutinase [Williamsia deligens]